MYPTNTMDKANIKSPNQHLPKTSIKSPSKLKTKKIKAGRIDKHNKVHNSKQLLEGECIFPFKYKRKDYYNCVDTGLGPWCATKIKPSGLIDKWGYCINE